jgi:hypothetical protein
MPDKNYTLSCDAKCNPKINYTTTNTSTNNSMISKKMQHAHWIRTSHRNTYTTSSIARAAASNL